DTLTKIEPSFALLGFARAVRIDTPDASVNLGVPSGSWQKAQLMRLAWDAQQRKLYSLGVWAKRVRDARTQMQRDLAEYRKQPVYQVVRPGAAVASIAAEYVTSREKIHE